MVPNTHLLFLVLLNSMVISSLAESLPSFVKSPEDQTGVSGGVASFVCQATGEPKPRITWMKNGKTISNRRTEMIEFDDGSGSVLRIELLRTDRDGAIYKCTATNSAGEINTSAKLTVHEENQIPHGFPVIDMGPQLKVVERTRTATMLCAASGNPDPEISWFKDMLPVDISSSNGRIKQLRSGALLIENSEESDQGKYECVAMNSAGTRYSAPANLYVRDQHKARRVPPRFSIPPTNQAVILGGSVNLTCVAVGSPMPYVKWMNGGVDLTKEEEMPMGRNVLEVTNIQESANYTCVAISPLGMIEATAQVTVKGLPSFVKSPEDQTGVSGGVASFVCQAAGEPKPRITWMKNGEKVSSQHFEVIEFDDGSGSVLRIEPLRTDRDEAIYKCTATNSDGEISTSAKLTVLEENQIPHGFPVIDMGPQLKVVEQTRTATMLCAASGNPDPEISWFKDMLPVDISSSNGRIKQLRSGALLIENSEESDQGKYECVAMNSAGTRYSAPANLYVRVQRVPPRFSIPPTNQEVILGGSVSLTCVAVGSPMPHVKWMNGGVDLTKEDEMPVGRNVLEVTNIQESANYTCVAMSSLGMIEVTAQVTVKGLPSFVKSPEDQTGVSGGVASFVCQATGEPKPRITWMKKGKVSSQRFEVIEFDDGSGSVLRIEVLRTHRDEAIYECTATNSAGEINTSAKLTVLEKNQIPHGFPVIDMGPQLKVVEWTRTATMLCAASGNPDPEISWFKDMLPVDISSSNGRIKQLLSGALQIENSEESDQGKYECVAMNSVGTRYSAPANLYVRVRRVPPRFSTVPTNQEVILGGSVNLTCVAVGSPMPYVKWMNGGVDLTKEEEIPVGRNVLEVPNIQESANYTCVAMSSLGMIEVTAQVTVKVPGAPPRKLEVEAINSTAIWVTWKPPLQMKQHGQIRGYQVIFSRLENGEPRGQPNIMDVALPEAQLEV